MWINEKEFKAHTETHNSTKVVGAHRTGRFYWVFSWHPSKGKLNGQRQDMEIWMTPDLRLHLICHIYVVSTSASLARNLFLCPVGGGLWFVVYIDCREPKCEKKGLGGPSRISASIFLFNGENSLVQMRVLICDYHSWTSNKTCFFINGIPRSDI